MDPGVWDVVLRTTNTTDCEFDVSGSVATAMNGVASTVPATWAATNRIGGDIVYQAA